MTTRRRQIALITEDFLVHRSIVAELKARNLNFITLSPKDPIPFSVRAVITTEDERDEIDFDVDKIVIAKKPSATIDRAQLLLERHKYEKIIIGIDPGKYSGIAVIGDGMVISVHQVSFGRVEKIVREILNEKSTQDAVIRIGHGVRLLSTQIINTLLTLGVSIELVDESFTTPILGKGVRNQISDIVAAINIAHLEGIPIDKKQIEPSRKEIQLVQEWSRERSNGRSTISRRLARQVAKGELTLDEAIALN
ncbi:MAG: hypothetical protein PHD13_06685 [Methanocellales archaeon]|nr:hypothetical protein [Methanocellales archaeon]MDD3291556.1 hypothetical protein [Methanocellales archaeon]MDD5235845.1 hypothetical protein [Methanocellales archaeon]MDD5485338.1 hypothetical protein [Methanocellales archaeon]